tara:strand:- start:510 stop:713 length:204 start_codon:yes stop_codon:yes gene_type:complete
MEQLSFNFASCEHCGDGQAEPRPAMTAYHWDGKEEDPNRNLLLCDHCYQGYRDYWTERWAEYYSGLL